MDTHKNARLTPKGREDMVRDVVRGGLTKAAAARQFNTTPKRFARSILETPFIAKPNSARHLHGR